jgi:RHS repeat-associated protein
LRKRRSALALIAVLVLASCLVDESFEIDELEQAVIPVLPPGGIVNTQANSGWTEGAFSVSNDGEARYSLPLWVPDGRGGLQPSLALTYGSRRGNGLVGVGWALSGLSQVTPCRKTVAHDGVHEQVLFADGDEYCLDGQRLRRGPTVDFETEYRTEEESFTKVVATAALFGAQPAQFKAWTPDGSILTFAKQISGTAIDAASSAENPSFEVPGNQGPKTVAWALSRIEDRHGNVVDITYDTISNADRWSNDTVPKQITYGPDRKIDLIYETRADPVDQYVPGPSASAHIRLGRRLKTIRMWAGTEELREYRLGYTNNSITGRSLLVDVTECDRNDVCLSPLDLDWSMGSNYFGLIPLDYISDVQPNKTLRVLDVNGDGWDDILYADAQNNWKVRLSTSVGFTAAMNAQIPRAGDGSREPRLHTLDYDRDGRGDVVVEVPGTGGNTKYALYKGVGTTFSYVMDVSTTPVGVANGLHSMYVTDLDGNGLPDLIAGDTGTSPVLSWMYRLNFGTVEGWDAWVASAGSSSKPPDYKYPIRITSLDGMPQAQLIVPTIDTVPNYSYLSYDPSDPQNLIKGSINLNLPFNKKPENDPPQEPGEDRRNLHFADVNGDGLLDAVYPLSGLSVQLNSGNGFSDIIPGPGASVYKSPLGGSELSEHGLRIVDFNGDGADDVMVLHTGIPSSSADSQQGIQLYTWRNGGFVRQPLNAGLEEIMGIDGTVQTALQPFDFNGDGLMDIVVSDGHGFGRIFQRSGDLPDTLTRVNVPGLGARVEVEYATLAHATYHTRCTNPNGSNGDNSRLTCPRRGGSIVAKHWVATGNSATPWNEFTHRYTDARFDHTGRGWLGFEKHTVTQTVAAAGGSAGGFLRTETTFDNTSTVALGGGIYAYPFANVPKLITYTATESGGASYEQTTTNQYITLADPFSVFCYRKVLKSSATSDRERAAGGSWVSLHSRTVSYDTFDAFNNPTKVTTTLPGYSDRVEEATYTNDQANWLLGQLRTYRATDCTRPNNVCVVRRQNRNYHPSGRIKEVIIEPDAPIDPLLHLKTTFDYGTYGNLTTVKRINSTGVERKVTLAYDTAGMYPRTATNDLGHFVEVKPDPTLGVPLETYDANRVPTSMKYDRFGRLREVIQADGYFERYTTSGPLTEIVTVATGPTTSTEGGRIIADVLGRPIEARNLAFGTGFNAVKTSYDLLGRVATRSRPHAVGGAVHNATFSYDLRGRLVRAVAPDNVTVTHEYRGLETWTRDGKGIDSYVLERSDGKIDSSFEDDPKSTSWLRTRLEYAPFDLVNKVIAPDSTAQTMKYDKRGRRFELIDPSAGKTTTTYNAFSDVTSEVNGANETSSYSYDVLGRLRTVTSPDGTTTYTWDPVNQKGKLSTAQSPDGVSTTYQYDDIGRGKTTTWAIEGTSYQMDVGYDGIGRLDTVTYPAFPGVSTRFQVKYTYKTNGHLQQVQDAATAEVYWRVNQRNAAGQLENETYGAGTSAVTASRVYSLTTGLLQSLRVDGPGGVQLDSLSYLYDNNRNVRQRKDLIGQGAKTQDYTHDTLNRLKTWRFTDASNDVTTTYDHNALGNLLSETVVGRPGMNVTYTYGPTPSLPHALKTRNGLTYGYDGAGRQNSGPGRTITYNRFNLPKRITDATGQTNFAYDAGGTRVLKRTPSASFITVGGIFERRVESNGTAANLHYIAGDGRPVAVVTMNQATTSGPVASTNYRSLYSDGQGSIIQTTNKNGAVAEEYFYDPYGRSADKDYNSIGDNGGGMRRGYTGHEHDHELNLVNMNRRVYDPVARRFLTPDPIIQSPLSSQSLNRYSYVWNNPATAVDPSGFLMIIFNGVRFTGKTYNGVATGIGGGGIGLPISPPGLLDGAGADRDPGGWPTPGSGDPPGTGPWKPSGPPFGTGNGDDTDQRSPTEAIPPGGSGGGATRYANGGLAAAMTACGTNAVCRADVANGYMLSLGLKEDTTPLNPFWQGVLDTLYSWDDLLANPLILIEGLVQDPLGWDAFVVRWQGIFEAHDAAARGDWGPLQRIAGQATPGAILGAIIGAYGVLRTGGIKDGHHIIQDAAVRDLPGYSPANAPAVQLPGPSTRVGSPHYNATQAQRQRGGGTYAAERRIGYKALRAAGFSPLDARALIEWADTYFISIGAGPTTPTRIPGNRR